MNWPKVCQQERQENENQQQDKKILEERWLTLYTQ